MDLLSVQRARSIWLFDIDDLNPRGKNLGTNLIDWLKGAYQFTRVPASLTDLDETKGLYYAGGKFTVRGEPIDVELRIYSDGFVGDTRSSTEDTDAFLSHVLLSAAKEFVLPYSPEIVRRRLYVSEMTVRCAKHLATVNPKLADFAGKLTQAVGAKSPLELASIGFWPDILPNPSASVFRFERKWGAEFSDIRYYTRAPLQTAKHLEILQQLEDALS
jgi:hypothetical protein